MSESAKPQQPTPQGKGEKTNVNDFGYVGIDAILEQMRRKAMKQGFELNIMVVGESDTDVTHLIQRIATKRKQHFKRSEKNNSFKGTFSYSLQFWKKKKKVKYWVPSLNMH